MFSYLLCFFTLLHCVLAGDSAWGNWPGANTVTTVTSSIVGTSISTATIVSISTTTKSDGQPTTVTVSQVSTVPVTIYTTVPTTFIITVVSVSTINSNGVRITTTISGPTSITTVPGPTSTTTITGPTSITAITTTFTSVTTETLNNGQTTTLTRLVTATFYSNTTGFDSNSQLVVARSSSNKVLVAAIAIAVIVGFIVVVCLAICLACCCIRRRRRNNGEHIENNFWGGAWGGGWGGGKGGSEGSRSSISAHMSQTNVAGNGGNTGGTTGHAGAATGAAAGATAGALAGAGVGAATGGARGVTNLRESTTEIDEKRTTVISIQNVQELNLFGAQAENGQHQRSSLNNVRYTLNQNQTMDMIAETDLGVRMSENQRYTRDMDSSFSRCRRHSHSNCSCRFSNHNRGESLTIGFTGRRTSRYSGSGRSRHRSTQIEDVERQDRYKGWVEVDYEEDKQETRYMSEEQQQRTKRNTIYDEQGDRSDNGDEVSIYPPSSTSLRIRSYQANEEESTAIFKALRSIGDTMDLNETNIHTHSGEADLQLEEKTLGSNWMDTMAETSTKKTSQTEVREVREIDTTIVKGQNVQTEIEEISSTQLTRSQSDETNAKEVTSAGLLTSRNTKEGMSQVISSELVKELQEIDTTIVGGWSRQVDVEKIASTQNIRNQRSEVSIDGLMSTGMRANYGMEAYMSQMDSIKTIQQHGGEIDLRQTNSTQLIQDKKGFKERTTVTVTELEDDILEIDQNQHMSQRSQGLATRSSEFILVEGGQINRQIEQIDIIKNDAFASTGQAGTISIAKSRSFNSTISGISNDSTQIGTDISPQTMKTAMTYQNYGGSFAARRYSGRSGAFMKSASSASYETSGISQVVKPITIVEVKEVDNRYDELY